MKKYLLLQQELRGRRVDCEGVAVRQAGVWRVAALPWPRRQAAQLQLQLRPGRPTISTRNIYTIHNMGTYKYDVITFRDIFTPPPPFPTASSIGTLVAGAHLMMSYLNKHFEPVPILCAADICLKSRTVNPIVYLVKKK